MQKHWIVLEREAPGDYDVPGAGIFRAGVPKLVDEDVARALIPALIEDEEERAKVGEGLTGARLARPDEIPAPAPAPQQAKPANLRALGKGARETQALAERRKELAQPKSTPTEVPAEGEATAEKEA